MTSSAKKVSFRASQTSNGSPKTEKFVEYLQAALEGGSATFDFFSGDMQALQAVAANVHQNGNAAWTQEEKGSALGYDFLDPDLPIAYTRVDKGTMVTQFHPSASAMGEETSDFKEAGVATTYLVTDRGPVDVIITYIEKLGPAVAGAALSPAIFAILTAVKNFVQQFITRAFSAASEGAADAEAVADTAAEGAAEEAAVDGEIIGDELALSVEFGPLAIAGIAVAAITLVVLAILFFLSKTMTCFIRFYNFTDAQYTLKLCYQYDLKVQQEPSTGVMPPTGTPPAPPGVKALDQVIYRADYTLLNSDDLQGLGLVISADGDPTNPTAFPGLTVMLDIPSVGDNSMYIELEGSTDCQGVFDNFSGTFKKLSMATCHGLFRLYMATNQLGGKSASPVTGEDGYFYEYLIVVEKEGYFVE
ncbi:MAG: hypothetical protein OEZ55_05630 [Nitrospinota bacterium]|nr:hypothetical protein [Nitrospinota bacterium]